MERKSCLKLWNQDIYRCFSTKDIISCANAYNQILDEYNKNEIPAHYDSIDNSDDDSDDESDMILKMILMMILKDKDKGDSDIPDRIHDNASAIFNSIMTRLGDYNNYQVITTTPNGDCLFESIKILIKDEIYNENGKNYTIEELKISLFNDPVKLIEYINEIKTIKEGLNESKAFTKEASQFYMALKKT